MRIGLRIDVDTLRGTEHGVPYLCAFLADLSLTASFFFSVGPDNMGRHLRRLIHPSFLWKMLRTRAPSLYGWDILLRGTFRPGPVIGERLSSIIKAAADDGHEIGLHAWDHHDWQANIDTMDGPAVRHHIKRGFDLLERILGAPPTCSAVPAWKCTDLALREKTAFPFGYNSDCRGESIFYPIVGGVALSQPQIPVTLPTYDEVIGHDGVTESNYNEHMLSLLDSDKLNVLTIHAEVEGIARRDMFERFVRTALARNATFVPLGEFLKDSPRIGRARVVAGDISGREGWLSIQAPVSVENENTNGMS